MTKIFMGIRTSIWGGVGHSETFATLAEAESFVVGWEFWEIRKLTNGVWEIVSHSGIE